MGFFAFGCLVLFFEGTFGEKISVKFLKICFVISMDFLAYNTCYMHGFSNEE